ncbi:ribosomal protein S18-alanine N-acetyltransferase [Compostimonas suwonensis]|uniref:Ribosomal-protein-alanine N-acetyltransferase n=1 Tax=Compostimonas suwonensis TaxID=1048394 RepID=A0A2M9BV73_9MICO|nr:ribosomal protein S18-alanine N-acetyltransferase [Compostimonas suwonensis]PJJ61845.1 ribosomal-protein-alanine N-acetyltransferase [Compostimonas suwonensis]
MTWQLRRATPADLDAIMGIETSVFVSDAWSRASMASELASVHGHYLVAFRPETPGTIDAYAGLHAPQGSPDAEIQTIAVAEHARRHGLGRVLMLQLIAEARRRGATEMFLEVRADNPPAQTLYLDLGFERIAVRPGYYQPDGVDAWVMRLALEEPRTTVAAGPAEEREASGHEAPEASGASGASGASAEQDGGRA